MKQQETAQALAQYLNHLDTRSMVAKRMRSWLLDAGYRTGQQPTTKLSQPSEDQPISAIQ